MKKPYIYKYNGIWWCLWGYFKGTGRSPCDAYMAAIDSRDWFWANH